MRNLLIVLVVVVVLDLLAVKKSTTSTTTTTIGSRAPEYGSLEEGKAHQRASKLTNQPKVIGRRSVMHLC
jgi:hypothetical protein